MKSIAIFFAVMFLGFCLTGCVNVREVKDGDRDSVVSSLTNIDFLPISRTKTD